MYARYIPPPKGANAAQKLTPAPEPERPTNGAARPSTTVGSEGFSYSRYIPGSKPSTQSKPSGVGSIQYFDEEPPEPTSKRKRDVVEEPPESQSKRSKKASGGPNGTADLGDQPIDSKKKKKRRKEKDDTTDGQAVPTASDELPKPDRALPKPAGSEAGEITMPGSDRKVDSKKRHKKEPIPEETKADEKGSIAGANGVETQESARDQNDDAIIATRTIKEKRTKVEKKKKHKTDTAKEAEGNEDQEDSRHKTVLERKAKALKFASKADQEADTAELAPEPSEFHGLEPLPQPRQSVVDTSKPTYETLPSWLAAPIRVGQDTRMPFTDLGLLPKAARVLEEKGYKDAFAVQTAAIPLLLPSCKTGAGDLLISAATGSGKTLAYALPIVRDMSQGLITRLRALVVLPTRELVKQAQEVFELCAKAYEGGDRKRVRIGVAVGSQSLQYEQETLMSKESRYDPAAYQRLQENAKSLPGYSAEETDPRIGQWEGEVIDFMSRVDILLCTPGRLVEHIEQTPGFSLDYVRWLVVDEADKLLAQSFQGWLEMVLEKFRTNIFSARDFPDMNFTGVRKVVLSATLTRDVGLLSQLALRRPQFIVLEGGDDTQVAEHTLPGTLKEFAVRVHDANLKPLYLLELLRGEHMTTEPGSNPSKDASVPSDPKTTDQASSESDSDSSSDSASSSTDSSPSKRHAASVPVSLIFTKSNESALRLSRLLTILDKSLSPHISTLTSTTPSYARQKTLKAFTTPSSPVRVIIASDLVARGIDLPKLDHVINYDLPPSVAGYVHRVGRTARAGRSGSAWTLVGDEESGWFWGKIAKGAGVRRAQKVGRLRIEEMSEERVEEYETALETLGKEALELRRR